MNYFKSKIQQQAKDEADIQDFKYPAFARTDQTGDRVFLIKEGTAHWIENPETLEAIGGGFDDVKSIPYNFYKSLIQGESLNMRNAKNYKVEEVVEGEVY